MDDKVYDVAMESLAKIGEIDIWLDEEIDEMNDFTREDEYKHVMIPCKHPYRH